LKRYSSGPLLYLENVNTKEKLELLAHPTMSLYLVRSLPCNFYDEHKWLSEDGLKQMLNGGGWKYSGKHSLKR
jgi:hypothetical protein